MERYVVLIVLIVFSGCSFEEPKELVNPQVYVDEFHELAETHGRTPYKTTLPLTFKLEPVDNLGQCDYETNTVTVHNNYWKAATPYCQKMLVFHELGHCLLLQNHRDLEDSIMNKYMVRDCLKGAFKKDIEYYIKELFEFGG